MSKSRRNVRFPHRPNGAERRQSLSEISDAASEPNSPGRNGSNEKPTTIPEEVRKCRGDCRAQR